MEELMHLGETDTEQFEMKVSINGEPIGAQKIHDPFICNTTFCGGWKWVWRALFGGIKVQVSVNGSAGAIQAVMTMDPYQLQRNTDMILEERRISRESSAATGQVNNRTVVGG
jgi:hypothetical protein